MSRSSSFKRKRGSSREKKAHELVDNLEPMHFSYMVHPDQQSIRQGNRIQWQIRQSIASTGQKQHFHSSSVDSFQFCNQATLIPQDSKNQVDPTVLQATNMVQQQVYGGSSISKKAPGSQLRSEFLSYATAGAIEYQQRHSLRMESYRDPRLSSMEIPTKSSPHPFDYRPSNRCTNSEENLGIQEDFKLKQTKESRHGYDVEGLKNESTLSHSPYRTKEMDTTGYDSLEHRNLARAHIAPNDNEVDRRLSVNQVSASRERYQSQNCAHHHSYSNNDTNVKYPPISKPYDCQQLSHNAATFMPVKQNQKLEKTKFIQPAQSYTEPGNKSRDMNLNMDARHDYSENSSNPREQETKVRGKRSLLTISDTSFFNDDRSLLLEKGTFYPADRVMAKTQKPSTKTRKALLDNSNFSSRFIWSDKLHKDFTSAIFTYGLERCSPSAALFQIQNNNPILTLERVEKVLRRYQYYGIHLRRSNQTDPATATNLDDKYCKPEREQRYQNTRERAVTGSFGQQLSQFSIDIVGKGNTEACHQLLESESESDKRYRNHTICFPHLTEEELKSNIGASLCSLFDVLMSLQNELYANRQRAKQCSFDFAKSTTVSQSDSSRSFLPPLQSVSTENVEFSSVSCSIFKPVKINMGFLNPIKYASSEKQEPPCEDYTISDVCSNANSTKKAFLELCEGKKSIVASRNCANSCSEPTTTNTATANTTTLRSYSRSSMLNPFPANISGSDSERKIFPKLPLNWAHEEEEEEMNKKGSHNIGLLLDSLSRQDGEPMLDRRITNTSTCSCTGPGEVGVEKHLQESLNTPTEQTPIGNSNFIVTTEIALRPPFTRHRTLSDVMQNNSADDDLFDAIMAQ